MTESRAIGEHGSRIIAALERAWAAIRLFEVNRGQVAARLPDVIAAV